VMEGRKVWKQVGDDFAPPDPAAPVPEPLHDARYRYESPAGFTASNLAEGRRPQGFV
jgi:hypothetical protein